MSQRFQISLESITVAENGRLDTSEAVNGLAATLFYPRSGVPSLTSVRTLRLKDKTKLDYSTESIFNRLLFKEELEGESAIIVEITSIIKASKFEKLLGKAVGEAAKAGIKSVPGLGPIGTAVATTAAGGLGSFFEADDDIVIIGKAIVPITEGMAVGKLTGKLLVPKDDFVVTLDHEKNERVRLELKQGAENGEVVLDVKIT